MCPCKKGWEREKMALALGEKMDAQTHIQFEHTQTKLDASLGVEVKKVYAYSEWLKLSSKI